MSVKSFASSSRTSRSKVRSTALTAKSTSSRGPLSSSFATKSHSTGALPPKGITGRAKAKASTSQSQYQVTEPISKPVKCYDPVEDLQRHYLEGDEEMKKEHESADDDEEAVVEAPGFLQKSMKFQQLNENLEKTSKALFQRIDSYIANKTEQNARLLEQEVDSKDKPIKSSGAELSFDKNTQFLSPSDRGTDNSDSDSATSSLISSLSSSLDNKKATSTYAASYIPDLNGSAPKTRDKSKEDPVDVKTRQRLQKASESVISCLQSKLHSYEGRIADMNVQYRQKIQENTMLESKIKLLEDDREKLLKNNSNLQNTSEKYAKAAETAKADLNLKAQALVTAKKEMELVKKELRLKSTALQNLQQKANRLTEENDRLKHQTRSTQLNMRDKQHEDRSVIDELHQRVNQLEQQKIILNSTISKQTFLIKALRNQRVSNNENLTCPESLPFPK